LSLATSPVAPIARWVPACPVGAGAEHERSGLTAPIAHVLTFGGLDGLMFGGSTVRLGGRRWAFGPPGGRIAHVRRRADRSDTEGERSRLLVVRSLMFPGLTCWLRGRRWAFGPPGGRIAHVRGLDGRARTRNVSVRARQWSDRSPSGGAAAR